MKVNAWKNLDIEVEVDVQLEDVLNELGSTADEEGTLKRKAAVIDQATRILAKLGADPLERVTGDQARNAAALLRERLAPLLAWCERVEAKGGAE